MTRTRRPRGEGGISPLRDESGKITGWEGSIEVKGGLGGKRKRKKVRAKTKTELSQKMRALRDDQERGVKIGTSRQTVAQYLQSWLKSVVSIKDSPSTLQTYTNLIAWYVAPHIGHMQLRDVTEAHITELRELLSQQKQRQHPDRAISPKTVGDAISVIKRSFNRAVKNGLIPFNPAVGVDLPKVENTVTALDETQAIAFLHALTGHRLEAFFTTLILTGMRKGEAMALVWADIDFENSQIAVSKSYQRLKIGRHTGGTKTKKTRVVAMPESLVTLLRSQQARPDADPLRVFATKHGTQLDPTWLWEQFKALLVKAELPETTTIHQLRHTWATLMLDQGESIVNVAAQLGHARVSTTLNTYASAVKVSQAKGVEMLGKRLKGNDDDL